MDDHTPLRAPDPGTGRRPPLALRILVVVLGATALWWFLLPWVSGLLPQGSQVGPSRWATAVMVTALAVPLVWAARRYLDRRPWRGLWTAGPGGPARPLLVGALAWALPGFAGIAGAWALGWTEIVPLLPAGELVVSVLMLACLVFLFEALPEELIFRGHLFRNLNASMSALAAVLVQAALFCLWGTALWVITHGWEVLGERAPLFAGMGIVLGCLRVVTGSLWACVGFHLVFQTTAQALMGGRLFAVGGGADAALLPFVLPFVFGVLVAALLTREEASWRARVPDPR